MNTGRILCHSPLASLKPTCENIILMQQQGELGGLTGGKVCMELQVAVLPAGTATKMRDFYADMDTVCWTCSYFFHRAKEGNPTIHSIIQGRIKHTLLLKTTAKESRNLLIIVKGTDMENESKQTIIYFLRGEKNFWSTHMLLQDSLICMVSDLLEIDSEQVKRLIIKQSQEKSVHTLPSP